MSFERIAIWVGAIAALVAAVAFWVTGDFVMGAVWIVLGALILRVGRDGE